MTMAATLSTALAAVAAGVARAEDAAAALVTSAVDEVAALAAALHGIPFRVIADMKPRVLVAIARSSSGAAVSSSGKAAGKAAGKARCRGALAAGGRCARHVASRDQYCATHRGQGAANDAARRRHRVAQHTLAQMSTKRTRTLVAAEARPCVVPGGGRVHFE